MAEEFHPAASLDDLADGSMKMVKIGEREILLARVGDNIYATQNRCPHMRGNLSRGKLKGSIVTCPAHGRKYDVVTGKALGWTNSNPLTRALSGFFSGGGLLTYPVRVDGGQVLVGVKKPAAA